MHKKNTNKNTQRNYSGNGSCSSVWSVYSSLFVITRITHVIQVWMG